MSEELVGTVTHYFARPQGGVVKVNVAIRFGDTLRFLGHGADFQQQVTSMEIEHAPVEMAAAGTEAAIKVDQRVRQGDQVYRVS